MKHLRSVTSTVARKFLILALAMLSLASGAARADAQGRDIVQLNRAWTFTLGDPAGAGAGGEVGKDWEKINLPHSFSMPYFLGSGFYVGYGWYRKDIQVEKSWQGKRLAPFGEAGHPGSRADARTTSTPRRVRPRGRRRRRPWHRLSCR